MTRNHRNTVKLISALPICLLYASHQAFAAVSITGLDSPVTISVTDAGRTVNLEITVSGLEWTTEDGSTRWTLETEGIAGKEGAPDLPAVGRWVRVPERGAIDYSYTIGSERHVAAPPPAVFQEPDLPGSDFDITTHYTQGRIWPPQPVRIGDPAVMRGVRIVPLSIHPVRWDADAGEYIVAENLTITIEARPGTGINEVELLPRQPSAGFDRMLDALLVNPPLRDQREYPPGGYLVVANVDYPEVVDEFANWKRRVGHPVEILTFNPEEMDEVGLKDLILDSYREFGFEYLILMGSDEADPPLQIPMDERFYDVYFAELEGGDILPDVAVGTMNCLTEDNLICAVRRAISYQSAPFIEEDDWFNRAAMAVGAVSVPQDLSPSYMGKWVADLLGRSGFDDVRTSFFADNGVDDPSPMIYDLYNDRVNFMLVRAHQWSFDADEVRRTGVYPFHFLVSSGTISPANNGAFNRAFRMGGADDLRGPSAGFGHYSSPRTNVANALVSGLSMALFMFDIDTYGWARNYAVANLQRVMVEDGFDLMPYYYSHWRYYGDPGQWCWMGVPVELNVVHPDDVDPDESGMEVTVAGAGDNAVSGAVVCISQPGGLQVVARTGNDGVANLTWGRGDLTREDIILSVTGENLFPYQADIPVRSQENFLAFNRYEIDDEEGGNGDGRLNPGERIGIDVELEYVGEDSLEGDLIFIFQVMFDSPWMRDASVEVNMRLDGLNPGDLVSFRVENEALAGCPDREVVKVMSFGGFSLEVAAPALEISAMDIENALEPGGESQLGMLLTNRGRIDAGALAARLESLSPFLTVTQGAGRFPAIVAGEEGELEGQPFEVRAAENAIAGAVAHLRMMLEGDPGIVDTLYFDLTLGEAGEGDPLGPDSYGYIALNDGDNDVEWADAPEYEWIEISPWMPEADFEGEALPIEMGGEGDSTVLVEMPFPFRFYGREFEQISVCSNGWIAPGDQTHLKNQQNWPLPGPGGAFGMIAVFWDRLWWDMRNDGLLAFYDEDGGRFIIEWITAVRENQNRSDNIFQAIIYDPERHPTPTGDCKILMQYRIVNNLQDQAEANAGCSVGISSPGNYDGLTYTYWNEYPPSCAPLQMRRAVLWTTIAYGELGVVRGRVVRFIDSTAVAGASVSTSHGFETISDRNGDYRMWGVDAGGFDMRASAERYGEVDVEGLELEEGGELEQDFVLPHGWSTATEDTLIIAHNRLLIPVFLVNGGNLSLDVDSAAFIPPDSALWDDRIELSFGEGIENVMPGDSVELELDFRIPLDELDEGAYYTEMHIYTDTPRSPLILTVVAMVPSAVGDSSEELPVAYALDDPYPNPFNSRTVIRFAVPKAAPVTLTLFDISGRKAADIISQTRAAGWHSAVFDSGNLPTGIYLVRFVSSDRTFTRKLALVR